MNKISDKPLTLVTCIELHTISLVTWDDKLTYYLFLYSHSRCLAAMFYVLLFSRSLDVVAICYFRRTK